MKKNREQLRKRNEFIKEAMTNPKDAGMNLIIKGVGLMNCKNTTDTVYALQDILYLSEQTIFTELRK